MEILQTKLFSYKIKCFLFICVAFWISPPVSAHEDNSLSNTCEVVPDFLLEKLKDEDFKKSIKNTKLDLGTLEFVTNLFVELRDAERVNQDLIYNFTIAVNKTMSAYMDKHDAPKSFLTFKENVEIITSDLKEISYLDTFSTNANLTRLIQCRFPSLYSYLQEIILDPDSNAASDKQRYFLKELKILARKIKLSRRYSLSVGLNYAYIPTFNYKSIFVIDASTITQGIDSGPRGSNRFIRQERNTRFQDEDYTTFRLTAKLRPFFVDVLVPGNSFENSFVVPVQSASIGNPGTRVLYQSTVETTFYIDYDLQARLSLRDIWTAGYKEYVSDEIEDIGSLAFLRQLDFGIGYGITGVSVEQTAVSDIRIANDINLLWGDLTSTATVENNLSSSFQVSFYQFYVSAEISDQLSVGLEYKNYSSARDDNTSIEADGDVLSLFISWTIL